QDFTAVEPALSIPCPAVDHLRFQYFDRGGTGAVGDPVFPAVAHRERKVVRFGGGRQACGDQNCGDDARYTHNLPSFIIEARCCVALRSRSCSPSPLSRRTGCISKTAATSSRI